MNLLKRFRQNYKALVTIKQQNTKTYCYILSYINYKKIIWSVANQKILFNKTDEILFFWRKLFNNLLSAEDRIEKWNKIYDTNYI